jgi:hypothetical protein
MPLSAAKRNHYASHYLGALARYSCWKVRGPMMFDLILNVINGLCQLRDAHTEIAITLLPAKVVQLSKSLVNPGR